MTLFYQKLDSPVGSVYAATDGKYLRILAVNNDNWNRLKSGFDTIVEKEHPILLQTKKQLDEFFSCQRIEFDLPVYFVGTKFQVDAWNALLKIPYGKTRSYTQQAQVVGSPKAVRAIGRTNGLNPISIIAPCHRVIGKSGKLTGYAGGLNGKKYLLDLEKRHSEYMAPASQGGKG